MLSVKQLEKRIIWISVAFVLVLLALSALAINLFHVGLPTCLTDIKPFQKGELITHSPTHYELHYGFSFFALLILFYAALWLVIYWIMIARA